MEKTDCNPLACPTRRQFIGVGAAAVATMTLGSLFPGRVFAADSGREVAVRTLPRRLIGSLAALKEGQPINFSYGAEGLHGGCFLLRAGRLCGGGVGPDRDVIAFSNLCTHMGMPLMPNLNAEHAVAGPCPLHLSTFDLTRHGIVVSGHATESLPQVVLEAEGDDIYATAMIGLVYGLADTESAR